MGWVRRPFYPVPREKRQIPARGDQELGLAWCFSTKVWDVAAGVLLIREAGGIAEPPDRRTPILRSGLVITASNDTLFARLRELVDQSGV